MATVSSVWPAQSAIMIMSVVERYVIRQQVCWDVLLVGAEYTRTCVSL
jgi:hypothetical protein